MNSIKDLMPLVPGAREDFDSHKNIYSMLQNGMVDLQKGQLRPHDRGYIYRKSPMLHLMCQAKCPEWMKF
ncbi:hypothetical protein ACT7C6_14890 [Bacillus paranthracis]